MNIVSILLTLVMLVSGGMNSAGTLRVDPLQFEVAGMTYDVGMTAELRVQNGDDESLMELALLRDGAALGSLQALLSPDALALAVRDWAYALPAQALIPGSGLTGVEAVLLEGAASLHGLGRELSGAQWLALAQQPLLDAPQGFELDAAQAGALLDGMAASLGEADAVALRTFAGDALGRLTGQAAPEDGGFGGLLAAMGLERLRWTPGDGLLLAELHLTDAQWEDLRQAFIAAFGLDQHIEAVCRLSGDIDPEEAARRLNEYFEDVMNAAAAVANADGTVTVCAPAEAMSPEELLESIPEGGSLEFIEPDGTVIINDENVQNAWVGLSSYNERYEVSLRFDQAGTEAFAEATARLIGQPIEIWLNGKLVSAPVVQTAITEGSCVISLGSSMSQEESYDWAIDLAGLLRSGMMGLSLEAGEARLTVPDMPLNAAEAMPRDDAGRIILPLTARVECLAGETLRLEADLSGMGLQDAVLTLAMDGEGASLAAAIPLGGERAFGLDIAIPLGKARRPLALLGGGSAAYDLNGIGPKRSRRQLALDVAGGSIAFSDDGLPQEDLKALSLTWHDGMFGLPGQGEIALTMGEYGLEMTLRGRLTPAPGAAIASRLEDPVALAATDARACLEMFRQQAIWTMDDALFGKLEEILDKVMDDGGEYAVEDASEYAVEDASGD